MHVYLCFVCLYVPCVHTFCVLHTHFPPPKHALKISVHFALARGRKSLVEQNEVSQSRLLRVLGKGSKGWCCVGVWVGKRGSCVKCVVFGGGEVVLQVR